jgi:hypothetical protein
VSHHHPHSFQKFEPHNMNVNYAHSLINCIENTINLDCASKHLIKSFKSWPIRRGCINHMSFLLFNFILIFHLAPLVTHLLPTPMHSWKMCI